MVLNKNDLTDYAVNSLGIWDALCELAGVDSKTTEDLKIITVEQEN